MIREREHSLNPLRWQWLMAVLCYLAVLLVSYNLLRLLWLPQQSLQWLLLATTSMAAQMAILWWALPYNCRQEGSSGSYAGDSLMPVLGYANAVTLLRGLLACLLAGFLFAPLPVGWLAWAPAVLYTLDRLVDFVDGYVARITHSETRLGEILDMEFDGLGILIAIMLGIQYGKLPTWYLLLGLSRPLFVLGMWLRRRAGLPVHDLPPSEHRRIIAGFQTGFITLVLWPLWPREVTWLAAIVMAVPLVLSFGRDWLVVSGVIDASTARYQHARHVAKLLIEGWLPLLARVGAVVLAASLLWHATLVFTPTPAGATGVDYQDLTLLFGWTILAGLLATGSVLLGAGGRIGALILAALAAFDIMAAGLQWDSNAPLLICALLVAHLGSGKFAVWRPEEPLLRAKAGAPRT